MTQIRRSQEWHTHISSASPVSGGLTVWHVRDFVRGLDSAGIPDSTTITCHHAIDTRHLIRLSVHTVHSADPDHPQDTADLEGQPVAEEPE